MKIIIASATKNETMAAYMGMNNLYTKDSRRIHVGFFETGVGMLTTAVLLQELIYNERPDLIIQAGLGGSFSEKLNLGSVVAIEKEYLGDSGVEEDGKWKDYFDLKLSKISATAFTKNALPNNNIDDYNLLKLPVVDAVTVNEISTDLDRAAIISEKYKATVESLEGAALHYVCNYTKTNFIQIRAISNYVGERNKANWEVEKSLDALNDTILKLVDKLYKIA